MVAGFLEIGVHDVLRVGLGLRLRQSHLPRCPFAEQPVAPGDDPEADLFVMRELGFESALAVVKLGHAYPLSSAARDRDVGRKRPASPRRAPVLLWSAPQQRNIIASEHFGGPQ